jgi:N-methylhydantoinase B
MSDIHPITLEVITEGLVSIVREMRQTVFRTAHSPVISEAQDFSCALFNPAGEMVAQSRDMPGHVIAMPASVAEAMKDFGDTLQPGDVILVNDPYRGGSHLNDVTVVYPVFVDGALFVFPCVRMHWADIGGMTPGSISGQATEILQEGVRIPPIRFVDAGIENRAAATLLFANVRSPEQRRGDLDACIAACRNSERRLREFAARYGTAEIMRYLEANLDRTEARLRRRIAALPDGTYRYEDGLDLFTEGTYDPVLIRCALTVAGDEMTADFAGSSPQVAAVVNASFAMCRAGVFIALKSVLDPGGMINDGAFRPIHIRAPEASVVNVAFPGPANAHSEVRKRVISAVMGALAQIVPDAVTADQCGTTFQNLLGGQDRETGRSYLYYDYPPGGNGGFAESDGPDAMNPVDLGDISTVQPVEVLEATSPVLVEFCDYRPDSCGDGKRRGGLGARRATRLLAENGSYSVQTDRAVVPPYGLFHGHPGGNTRTYLLRGAETIRFATPGKVAGQAVRRGDVLVMEAAGGGGWGDPLDRETARVAADLAAGLISQERAESVYGLVFASDGTVDQQASTLRRQGLSAKIRLKAADLPAERCLAGNRGRHRRAELHPATLAALGIEAGTLLELHGRHPAPLRAWAYEGNQPEGCIAIGSDAQDMTGIAAGTDLVVRPIATPFKVS